VIRLQVRARAVRFSERRIGRCEWAGTECVRFAKLALMSAIGDIAALDIAGYDRRAGGQASRFAYATSGTQWLSVLGQL